MCIQVLYTCIYSWLRWGVRIRAAAREHVRVEKSMPMYRLARARDRSGPIRSAERRPIDLWAGALPFRRIKRPLRARSRLSRALARTHAPIDGLFNLGGLFRY